MVTNRKRVQVIVSTGVLFLLSIVATSCNGFFVDPVLQTITVTPATPGILVNGTQQMTATGTYDDGSQKNLTGTSSWTSSDLTVATVTASGGLVTGVSDGTATIQATMELSVDLRPSLSHLAASPASRLHPRHRVR